MSVCEARVMVEVLSCPPGLLGRAGGFNSFQLCLLLFFGFSCEATCVHIATALLGPEQVQYLKEWEREREREFSLGVLCNCELGLGFVHLFV